jgi:hypothetical protein
MTDAYSLVSLLISSKPAQAESSAPATIVHTPSLTDPVEEKVKAERDEGGDEGLLNGHAAQV